MDQLSAALPKNLRCNSDPGGYFVVRGTEKVILIQEQMSKNRMIVEQTKLGTLTCQVTSSTHNVKSRTNVLTKNGKYYLQQNLLGKFVSYTIRILRNLFNGTSFSAWFMVYWYLSCLHDCQNTICTIKLSFRFVSLSDTISIY